MMWLSLLLWVVVVSYNIIELWRVCFAGNANVCPRVYCALWAVLMPLPGIPRPDFPARQIPAPRQSNGLLRSRSQAGRLFHIRRYGR